MTVVPGLDAGRRATVADLRVPALVGGAGLAAAVLLRVHDPHGAGSYGYCPFLALTGKPCPGCGGLRAVNDLTHGDVTAAASSNLLAVALVAILAVAWVLWVVRRLRGTVDRMITMNVTGGLVMLGVVVAFGIARSTAWGAWLAP